MTDFVSGWNTESFLTYPVGPLGLIAMPGTEELGDKINAWLKKWRDHAEENEPGDMGLIESHMKALGRVAAHYSDDILTLQGLFVGDWGELHGGRYCDDESIKRLYHALGQSPMGDMRISLRTPYQMRLCMSVDDRPIGIFDDAILSDERDMGTFGLNEREPELSFLESAATASVNGGETVLGEGSFSPDQIVSTFKRMHMTYLNRQHDMRVYEKWQGMDFEGQSLYDHIKSHLGYRIYVGDVLFDKKGKELTVVLINSGFAALLERCECTLTVRCDGKVIKNYGRLIYGQTFLSGMKTELVFSLSGLERGEYRLDIGLLRTKDERRITFSNDDKKAYSDIGLLL